MSTTVELDGTEAAGAVPIGLQVRTSESVSEGHPDKVCDYVADSILDAYLALDPRSRVAAETAHGRPRAIPIGRLE